MSGFHKDESPAETRTEAESPPDGKALTESKADVKISPSLGSTGINELRVKMGYRLAFCVILGILGVFFISSILFMIRGSDEGIRDFSLEVIRLLIPPFTFIIGYLFGVKQQE